eukprot:2521887-Ditylum_brightwellii.AAC.1
MYQQFVPGQFKDKICPEPAEVLFDSVKKHRDQKAKKKRDENKAIGQEKQNETDALLKEAPRDAPMETTDIARVTRGAQL